MIQFIIIIIIIIIIFLILFRTTKSNHKQLAGLFPTKECDYKDYYYLWIYMEKDGKQITDKNYRSWVRKIQLSGPNILGIYTLFSNENFLLIFWIHFLGINLFLGSWVSKDAFKYKPKYIRFKKKYISENLKLWSINNQLKIKTNTYNLSYC